VVTSASKFGEGAWVIVLALPLLVLAFGRVHRAYQRMGDRLGVDRIPPPPRSTASVVVVPVHGVSALTQEALSAALSLGDEVVAVRVVYPDEPTDMHEFRVRWEQWQPDVPLAMVDAPHRDLGKPLADFINHTYPRRRVLALIAEVEPEHLWERILRNHRGTVIEHALRRHTQAIVCRMRYRLTPREEPAR
jgi:hypothetical protein